MSRERHRGEASTNADGGIDGVDQSTGIGPSFEVTARLDDRGGRAGVLTTPHGVINTPAFVPVATKATVKAVLPETMADLGAQALLANAYHLYLQPGHDIVEEAGGLGRFMNWPGPTFTDSGGFQVLSLGSGYKKVLAMEAVDAHVEAVAAKGKDKLARVDEDGVTFTSHLNGSKHRFTPEVSMRIQHALGADIIFAFDELTTLANTRDYQISSVARTHRWAQRCLDERARLTAAHPDRPEQALFGVVQGAQYEDLRRQATRGLLSLADESGRGFEGFGIGGALEKSRMGTIVRWVTEELPDDKPRHLLGISEPDDLFAAVEAGADTFDCVNPSRVARNAAIYTPDGRFNINTARFRRDFTPIDADCDCYTCGHYTRAYLHHLFKAKEMVASTLATIHNERFTIRLVDTIRAALSAGDFDALRTEFLGRFYGSRATTVS